MIKSVKRETNSFYMSGKTKAIISGGLAAGIVLSIPYFHSFWFLWAFLGGLLSSSILINGSSAQTVSLREGGLVGGIAGAIGGFIGIFGLIIFTIRNRRNWCFGITCI